MGQGTVPNLFIKDVDYCHVRRFRVALIFTLIPGDNVSDSQKIRNDLRKRILKSRDSLSPGQRQSLSAIVAAALWQDVEFQRAELIFLYVNFRSEVETFPLIKKCLLEGKQVVVPLVAPESKLIPYRIVDLEKDLTPGAFGIQEPIVSRCEFIQPDKLDLVVLPGSVFDERGGRMGYGGGFYDRFLANEAPQAKRIGLAFDLQVVEAMPLAPHDQLVDKLVTESRMQSFKRLQKIIP